MIRVRNAYKTFRPPNRAEVKALVDFSTHIEKGEVVVIIGPSGSGKSTFLRCLNRLEEIDSGEIIIDGVNISDKKINMNKVREEIGMVFQLFNLFPHKRVLENVTLALQVVRKKDKEEAIKIARDLLNKVGILEKEGVYPSQLSGGQQQRVAIARALVNDPVLILADEPTGNLDTRSGEDIMNLLHELHEDGRTIVMVTHDHEIAEHTQRTIHLRDGKVEKVIKNGKKHAPRDKKGGSK